MWAFSDVTTVKPLLTPDQEFGSRTIKFDWRLWETYSTVLRWHQTVRDAHISFCIVLGSHIIMHQDPIQARDGEWDKTAECSRYHLGCLHQNNFSGWDSTNDSIFTEGCSYSCLWRSFGQNIRHHDRSKPSNTSQRFIHNLYCLLTWWKLCCNWEFEWDS